jgi:hypothetical protein
MQKGKHMTVAGGVDMGQREPRQAAQPYCKMKYDGRREAQLRRAFPSGFPGFPSALGLVVHSIHNHPCGNRTDRCAIKIRRNEPWR